MKKNKMMRVASVLLVAVLLTTSIISGTFAKYVTSDEAENSARVAKFGVEITAEGDLFAETYVTHDEDAEEDGDSDSISVESSESGENVVAPGTANDEGLTITVTGTPEVDVRVTFEFGEDDEDIFLDDYHPIVYTLTKDGEDAEEGSLEEIKAYIAANYDGYYDANTDLEEEIGELNLTWAWDFDADGVGTNDEDDTTLGDLAAGIDSDDLEEGEDYNLDVSVSLTITVTQVD